MKQLAHVVSVEESSVTVRVRKTSGCNSCSSSTGCSTATAAKLFSKEGEAILSVKSNLDVNPGDPVYLVITDRSYRLLAFRAYGLPLIGFVLGALLGANHAENLNLSNDLAALITGLLGGSAGIWLGRQTGLNTADDEDVLRLEKI